MHFGVLGLCETPAAPKPSGSHTTVREPNLGSWPSKNTTKIQRENIQRERKRTKMGAGEGKKRAKCWAPTLRSHPSGPNPSGPHPSGPHPLGPHPLGNGLAKNGLAKIGQMRMTKTGQSRSLPGERRGGRGPANHLKPFFESHQFDASIDTLRTMCVTVDPSGFVASTTARELQTRPCPGPGASNTTKVPQKDPQEREKRKKSVAGE